MFATLLSAFVVLSLSEAAVLRIEGSDGLISRPVVALAVGKRGAWVEMGPDLLALAAEGQQETSRTHSRECADAGADEKVGRNRVNVLSLLLRGGAGVDDKEAPAAKTKGINAAEEGGEGDAEPKPARRGRPAGQRSRGAARSGSKRSLSKQEENLSTTHESGTAEAAAPGAALADSSIPAASAAGDDGERSVLASSQCTDMREEEEPHQHGPPRAPLGIRSVSPTQNIPGMHSPGTGNTLLPGEVDLPAELQMPPSMQHMYHWEAPDGNQFIMDPLAAASSGPPAGLASATYAAVASGVGAPALDHAPPPWQPGHAHHRLGDQLYALGGYDGGGQLSTVESLDTQTGMWRTEAPMLSKRGALSAVLLDGRIFAIGGNDGRRDLATVESFDSASGSWRSEVPMPSKRRALTALVCWHPLCAVMHARYAYLHTCLNQFHARMHSCALTHAFTHAASRL
jgi:hypothetical protein